MECTSLRERERERERVQKSKINEGKKKDWKKKQHMKGKMGEKCTHTHKIGQVRRKSLENFFWTKWEWTFVAQGNLVSPSGIFFSTSFTLQIGEIAIWWVRGENLWTPIFLPIFFSYQIHQNINFSFILFFSIILKIHPTKQTSLEKSSISLY